MPTLVPSLRLLPLFLLMLAAQSPHVAVGQEWVALPANGPAMYELKSSLAKVASIRGDIRQEKTFAFLSDKLVSKGSFAYKKENRLRWQFTDPVDYIILIDGSGMRMREDGQEKQYKGASKILRQVREIILGCIDGSIIDNPSYKVSLSGHDTGLRLELQPRDRQLREFIQRIEAEFDRKAMRIASVRLTDPSGDVTHISFSNVKTGIVLEDGLFTGF